MLLRKLIGSIHVIGRAVVYSSLVTAFAFHSIATVQAEDKGEKLELAGGKLLMIAPANWESVPPKSQILEYEFKAPKDKKEDTARITVSSASGSIDANIERWIGQFDGAKKDDAKIDKKDVAGVTVHMVDIAGTFKDSMGGGPFAPGPVKKRENYRMLGAIIETKEGGKIFVKMTGPKDTVESLAEGFKSSLHGLTAK